MHVGRVGRLEVLQWLAVKSVLDAFSCVLSDLRRRVAYDVQVRFLLDYAILQHPNSRFQVPPFAFPLSHPSSRRTRFA